MIHKISGDLKVTVNTLGAELTSIETPDGHEYLWQGRKTAGRDNLRFYFP